MLFYMNDSNIRNEFIYLPCWLLSTQYCATEVKKCSIRIPILLLVHYEHSRNSLLFFSFLSLSSNNHADPDLSVLTVTV